jgi:hypothetical protein
MVSLEWINRSNFNRNLAVVIGIDQYNDPISNLSTPVSDANAFADLLKTKFEYQREDVRLLTNNQANLTGLCTLLNDTLPNHINPTESDRLIFYFAGHGLPINSDDGPQGYLVPQDADPSKVESFLSMNEVYDALNKLQCHHLLVILDCCFAGTFRWASNRKAIVKLEKIYREHYDRFIRFPAWQLITSSAHDQEALDIVTLSQDRRGRVDDQNHSPFALALLEALQDGDPDSQGQQHLRGDYTKDGVITAHELIIYLRDRVSQLAKERQVPGLYPLNRQYDRGEFIFVQPGFDPRQRLSSAPELNEENNPYRGLKPFEERHAQFFFGRKKLLEKLSDRLTNSHHPLTIVVGMSGSGKSSLVKAGLLPDLRNKNTEAPAQLWYILAPMRPGKSPFAELAKTLLPIANNLIADLSQINFLNQKFEGILNPQSGHEQQGVNQPSTSPDSQDELSGDLVSLIRIAKWWNAATQDNNDAAKLELLVNYFNQLQEFCDQEQKEQLSDLHVKINDTLAYLTKSLEQNPKHFTNLMTKWSQSNPGTKLLLVIDQFEELVTMNQDNRGFNEQRDSQEEQDNQWQRFLFLLRNKLLCSLIV